MSPDGGLTAIGQETAAPLELVAAALRGDAAPWPADGGEAFARTLLLTAAEHGVDTRLADGRADAAGWPPVICEYLRRAALDAAVVEVLRQQEVRAVLDSLSHAGVRPLVLKGTALAVQPLPDAARTTADRHRPAAADRCRRSRLGGAGRARVCPRRTEHRAAGLAPVRLRPDGRAGRLACVRHSLEARQPPGVCEPDHVRRAGRQGGTDRATRPACPRALPGRHAGHRLPAPGGPSSGAAAADPGRSTSIC